jgi:hypothetical protein
MSTAAQKKATEKSNVVSVKRSFDPEIANMDFVFKERADVRLVKRHRAPGIFRKRVLEGANKLVQKVKEEPLAPYQVESIEFPGWASLKVAKKRNLLQIGRQTIIEMLKESKLKYECFTGISDSGAPFFAVANSIAA